MKVATHPVGVFGEIAIKLLLGRRLIYGSKAAVGAVEMDGDKTAGIEHVRNVGIPHPLLECRRVALGALEGDFVAYHGVKLWVGVMPQLNAEPVPPPHAEMR